MIPVDELRHLEALCAELAKASSEVSRRSVALDFLRKLEINHEVTWIETSQGARLAVEADRDVDDRTACWLNVLTTLVALARDAAVGIEPALVHSNNAFRVRFGSEVRRARRYNSVLALVHFHAKNADTVMDEVVLEKVRRSLRESDLLGSGVQGFNIALPSTDRDGLAVTLERVMALLNSEAPEAAWANASAVFPYDGWTDQELFAKVMPKEAMGDE